MAKRTDVYTLKTDTGDAVKDVQKLDKDMTHLAETIGVEVSGSISAMEDRLYELALAGEKNSDEFRRLQKQTAEYKKIIIETDRSIDQLAEQGRGLSTALGLAESTVAGYQAFVGVSALLGDENEELLETITKLEAAQGVLNSIMVVKEQLQFNAIKLTQAQAAAQRLLNVAVGNGSKAMKLFRGALLATGIGAIIIAVGYLIANFDKLRDMITGASQDQRDLNATMDDYKKGATDAIAVTNEVENAFRLAKDGVISKEEALKTYNEQLGDSFGKAKDLEEAERLFVEKTDAYIEAAALRAQAQKLIEMAADEQVKALTSADEDNRSTLTKYWDFWTKTNTFGLVDNTERHKKAAAEQTKNESEANAERLKNLAASIQKEAKTLEDANNIKTKEAHETKKKQMIDMSREIQDLQLELEGDTLEAALERNRLFYQRKIEDTLANETILASQKEQLVELFERQLEEKRLAIFDEFGVKELEIRKAPILEVGQTAQDMEIQRTMTMRTESEERIRLSQEEKDAMVSNFNEYTDIVSGGLESLNNLNDLVTTIQLERAEGNEAKQEAIQKKSFERNKKIQIAMATIQGIQGVVNALTAASVLPEPFGSIQKGIQAAVVATSTAANIAKIKATKFQGGGSVSSGGGGGIQGATASQFSIGDDTSSAQTFLNQDGSQQGSSQPQKVYVTETDISNTQQAVNQINVRSTF